MEAPQLLLLLLCFGLLLPASPTRGQLVTMVTPAVLRLETEELVVLEAPGSTSTLEATVLVQDFPRKRQVLHRSSVQLEPAQGMLATTSIKVPARLLPPSGEKQFVSVVAQVGSQNLEKVLLVALQSGHIFVQTDKPIYTPGSTVLCRLFAVDHLMKPSSKVVVVELKTPDNVIIKQVSKSSPTKNGIISYIEHLPEVVSMGTWTILARFEDSPEQTFSTQFEVKEYVLPSFEVVLEPEEKFLYIDQQEDFKVFIKARYLYGSLLQGTAFALFGVLENNEKRSIPKSLKRLQVVDGDAEAVLPMALLRERFAEPQQLVGHSLYVTVTVLTETGSDMVEAQRGGISIVTSPYSIHFTRTPKYFKPGMPFDLTVYVTNPDESPAPRVAVQADGFEGEVSTQQDGTARLVLNMPANKDSVDITVRTAQARLPAERQASRTMTAKAYRSQGASGNFLHLTLRADTVQAGENLPINFHLKSHSSSNLDSVTHFTYLLMSRGRILKAERQRRGPGQSLVSMTLPVSPELIPSFRIVAYYVVKPEEIVADSIWVDVKDTCMGSLVVTGATAVDNRVKEPQGNINLRIEGDHKAHVGLVAVDKGVFVLNKKNKLTQAKVWDTVEKSDLGCTSGSGRDNVGVFADAGLSLVTSSKVTTAQRAELRCPQVPKRRRRSLRLVEYKSGKAAEYQDKQLRKCCEDGMKENLMGYSCAKRILYIQEGDACTKAFLDCCTFIQAILDKAQRETHLLLARSEEEDIFLEDEGITSRTQFPESWLWQVEELKETPNRTGISKKTLSLYVPDSITTWEVQAISISSGKGLCVASPYEITVVKDFFIDLRLPYSVVRNEQVEIRAVLYNYLQEDILVRVELLHNPALCSASTSKARYQQVLKLKAQSSRAVPFVIVPLLLGHHDVEVKAAVRYRSLSDGVKKKLKVVPEGIRKVKNVTIVELDPKNKGINGVQNVTVKALDLWDKVPDTESETRVLIQGNPVSNLVEKAIDGSKLRELIVTPTGCGEQNMFWMTPTVIATHYLDSTSQWEAMGLDRRAEAINLIRKGYTQQLAYRKPESSFAIYPHCKSSTWLTAYVAKVFSMAINLIDIEPEVICGAVKWLILEKQNPDGIFKEDAPVLTKAMTGGYQGAEPEVSLTAFVLVALLESKEICRDYISTLDTAIDRAAEYLSKKYQGLARPYTVALTSYALALAGKLHSEKVLMKHSKGGQRWEDYNARTYNVEGTSYALLALLQMQKLELTGPVARWLAQQNHYDGTYGSTQATILVFQALAQHQLLAPPQQQELSLDVSLLLPERSKPDIYRIENRNALLARSAETKVNKDFTVQVEGTGKGTMTVVTIYNAQVPEKEDKCDSFNLTVQVEKITTSKDQGAFSSVMITTCVRHLDTVDATMAIIDVSMLTGFVPEIQSLNRLTDGVDKYASKYELNNNQTERSNLIIYLDKVSHQAEECLSFRAHQHFQVGWIQPAAVSVYSYYRIDDRCTRFYHPDKQGGKLSRICQGDVCRCAEESCYKRHEKEESITANERLQRACEPGVDYVYKVKLVAQEEAPSHDNYIMNILSVIKMGTDENPAGKNRTFVSHQQCREALSLRPGQDYLLWGLSSDLWATGKSFSYFISKDTWMELWPSEVSCQAPELQDLCQSFLEFEEQMRMFGCQT
ncbi:complement C3 [Pogoniulus pusillus]|uniref:complement C3 n=1 Tax=Pogoniulus pusillus TaxID=488313 RepID=UPI0030B99655